MKRQKGFTLLELLIVIGIIAFLASAIFIAVDPAKRFAEARNARRWEDVASLLEAVLEFAVDNGGTLPTGIDNVAASSQVLGTDASGCDSGCTAETTVAACLDMSGDLVDDYLAAIPYDPFTGDAGFTDYYLNKSGKGRIEIGACDPELGATIFVTR